MKNTKKLVLAALFAALTCVATMAIRIPTPGTGGYIHPGDAIVILAGVFLGSGYGALAAGIGSAMSDLIGGYFLYVPITFIIKGSIAFLVGHAFHSLKLRNSNQYVSVALCGLIDAVLVAGGYGIFEIFLYGLPAAVGSMIPNLVQGIGGMVIGLILFPILSAIPDFRHMLGAPSAHK